MTVVFILKKNEWWVYIITILDSGFFCILLRAFKGLEVKKFSGYLFLKNFLNIKFTKNTRFLIIDPNFKESKYNLAYLI